GAARLASRERCRCPEEAHERAEQQGPGVHRDQDTRQVPSKIRQVAHPRTFWHGPAMRWPFARRARAALFSLLASAALASLAACGGAPPPPPQAARPPPRPPEKPAAPPPKEASWLPASVLAQIEDEKTSPYFARRGDDGLLLYADGGRWL